METGKLTFSFKIAGLLRQIGRRLGEDLAAFAQSEVVVSKTGFEGPKQKETALRRSLCTQMAEVYLRCRWLSYP
jgi:hypothetical protein